MSLGVGRRGGVDPAASERQELAPAAESCSTPQGWIPLRAFPAVWAQGDRLSTAAAPLSHGRAGSVPPSSLNLEVHLAADALRTFSGGVRGSSLGLDASGGYTSRKKPSGARHWAGELATRQERAPGAPFSLSCALQGWNVDGQPGGQGRCCPLVWAGLARLRKDGFGAPRHQKAGGSNTRPRTELGSSLPGMPGT